MYRAGQGEGRHRSLRPCKLPHLLIMKESFRAPGFWNSESSRNQKAFLSRLYVFAYSYPSLFRDSKVKQCLLYSLLSGGGPWGNLSVSQIGEGSLGIENTKEG